MAVVTLGSIQRQLISLTSLKITAMRSPFTAVRPPLEMHLADILFAARHWNDGFAAKAPFPVRLRIRAGLPVPRQVA